MKVKIICTIGPGSNNPEILSKLAGRNIDFFRINLSHTDESEIEQKIKDLLGYNVPIILDTEGNQVRSGNKNEIELKEGSIIKIYDKELKCNSEKIFLNPPDVIRNLSEGDILFIDFNSVLLKVFNMVHLKNKGCILCKTLIGGKIGGKKAVHIDSPTFKLPPFSSKDLKVLELGKKYGIKYFTLSFMESPESVMYFRSLYPEAKLYSKIESIKGLINFENIARVSDGILIDRGDLSSQVPIERIPLIQKFIINKVRNLKKEVFIATNTLEQMSFSLKPNRAEVNDILTTILDGATGIALTKETAIGKNPIETVNMLLVLIEHARIFRQRGINRNIINKLEKSNYLFSSKIPGLLIKPHGGKLIDRVYKGKFDENKIPQKKIILNEEQLMDIEQIAVGSFSPLKGFMCKNDFYSVLNTMRLSNGLIWPLPITLNVKKEIAEKLILGENISLIYENDIYAILHLKEIYKIDKLSIAKKLYATDNTEHPGVKKTLNSEDYLLGGEITLLKRRNSPYKLYELTPRQTRRIFYERGWSKVIGFHTRNVAHKGHEFLHNEGLKISLCDGLFIHPIIGKKKKGDFESEIIMETYEKIISSFYSSSKILLSAFASYSRYAGPREALFTALVRKNFGCSHFIVGRDHTGVGNFYSPTASHEIFDKFKQEEIGIIPVKFDNIFYSDLEKRYIPEKIIQNHPEDKKLHLSGTEARELLKKQKRPPEWFMRKEVSDIILGKIKKGSKVFVE